MSIEELLKVYHFDLDKKKRLGVNTDGGYVIVELDGEYDCYISAGVSNEESFKNLGYWVEELKKNLDPFAIIALCANKVDIMFTSPEKREVLRE
jgi:5'(3')-deoxyribonucleotidase